MNILSTELEMSNENLKKIFLRILLKAQLLLL